MNGAFVIETGLALCLQVSLIVLITAVLERRVGNAASKCRLWSICFLAILGLVAAALVLPHRRLFEFPEFVSRDGLILIANWQGCLATALLAVWIAGVVWKLLRSGFGCFQLLRFLDKNCRPVSERELAKLGATDESSIQSLMRSGNAKSELRITVSDHIYGPFCWQLHRPIVVLPTYLLDEDPSSLQHVLIHEMEHLRTKHPMQHFLQGVCSTVFWFHPAIWVAANGAELTREYLCDEVAAVTSGKFGAYLRTLVTIAEHCGRDSCTHVPKGTLAFGNQKSALLKRSDRLVRLASAENPNPPSQVWSAIAFGVLLLAAISVSQIWLPTNALASNRSSWSPWPKWSANVLHIFNIEVRDFEPFDEHTPMYNVIGNRD